LIPTVLPKARKESDSQRVDDKGRSMQERNVIERILLLIYAVTVVTTGIFVGLVFNMCIV
jgi:uncharacterized membrane protein